MFVIIVKMLIVNVFEIIKLNKCVFFLEKINNIVKIVFKRIICFKLFCKIFILIVKVININE